MLLKDVKTEYETHRVFQYNEDKSKVLKRNVEMRPIYENIYIGKPEKGWKDEKWNRIYIFFNKYDVAMEVASVISDEWSVVNAVSQVSHKFNGINVQDFMKTIDSYILSFDKYSKLYISIAKAINPERAKIYRNLVKCKKNLEQISSCEQKNVKEKDITLIKKSFEKLQFLIDNVNGDCEIKNELLRVGIFNEKYKTIFGFIAEQYDEFVKREVVIDIDSYLEKVIIRADGYIDVIAPDKKRRIQRAVRTIISHIRENGAKLIYADEKISFMRMFCLKEVKGDILSLVENPEEESVIVCHQVNCKGVMGAGLAKQIKKRFPEMYEFYKAKCDKFGKDNLGTVYLCGYLRNANYKIANVFSQNEYDGKGIYTDYQALRNAFSFLRKESDAVIRIPYKMGCELGTGDWKTVKQIISEELISHGCKVEIWKKGR